MKKALGSALSVAAACMILTGCGLSDLFKKEPDEMIDSNKYGDSGNVGGEDNEIKWVLEPTISADNIVVFDSSQINPDKESNKAYLTAAIIYRDGKYGFIDYYGNIIVEPKYSNYYTCDSGEMVLYNITDEKNDVREYCTLDSQGQVHDYVNNHVDATPNYYWNSDTNEVYVLSNDKTYATKYTGKKTIVVSKAKINSVGNGYYEVKDIDESKFALAKEDKLISKFEYDDFYAPSFKGAGLTSIALKKDNLWGYVDSAGKEIIDFTCDGIYSSYNGTLIDEQNKIHPFLFTEDFLPVSVGSTYGYYNIDGECVVKIGEFEQARPVHNGRAWVRKNGVWGVIQLGEIIADESKDDSVAMTTPTSFTTSTSKSSTTTTTTASSVSDSQVTTTTSELATGTSAPDTSVADTSAPPTEGTIEAPPATDPVVPDPVDSAPIADE